MPPMPSWPISRYSPMRTGSSERNSVTMGERVGVAGRNGSSDEPCGCPAAPSFLPASVIEVLPANYVSAGLTRQATVVQRRHPTSLRGILGQDPKAELQRFDDGLTRAARRTPFRRQHDTNDDVRECPSALRLIHVSHWCCW